MKNQKPKTKNKDYLTLANERHEENKKRHQEEKNNHIIKLIVEWVIGIVSIPVVLSIFIAVIRAFNNNSFVKMLCKKSNDFGFLCPKNRMGFIVNGVEKDKTTAFYSFWLCYKTKIKGWKSMEENYENSLWI